jgi:hypothetical protein
MLLLLSHGKLTEVIRTVFKNPYSSLLRDKNSVTGYYDREMRTVICQELCGGKNCYYDGICNPKDGGHIFL